MSLRPSHFEFTLTHITALMDGATPEQLDALRLAWSLVHYAEQLERTAAADVVQLELGETPGAPIDPRATSLDRANQPAPRRDVAPVVVRDADGVAGTIRALVEDR